MQTFEYTNTLLKVSDLSLNYGDKKILDNINFEIKDVIRFDGVTQGQVVAFLGRSGRGKSSLFKLITGLEQPTKGNVEIANVADGYKSLKKIEEGEVGFVDQKYTLFRNKTIVESLQFAMRKSKLSNSEKEKELESIIKNWGLEKAKNNYPNELSGGQRQRTAILEQILNSSAFLVLDEPFSGLDVGNIENVKNAMKLISSTSEENTIIFSTHDVEIAVELADIIYIIGYQDGQTSGVIKKYNLMEMGLAWNSEFTSSHFELCKEIKNTLLNS